MSAPDLKNLIQLVSMAADKVKLMNDMRERGDLSEHHEDAMWESVAASIDHASQQLRDRKRKA